MRDSMIVPGWALKAANKETSTPKNRTRESAMTPTWVNDIFGVLEGKQQALAIIPDKTTVNILAEADPTPSNKYVELFAKLHKGGTSIDQIRKLTPLIKEAEQKRININLGQVKTYDEFEQLLTTHATKITKGSRKAGVAGLKEGVDYIDFGSIVLEGAKYYGYIPLNHEASQVLASSRVGGVEGKWCISYQKDDSYWKDYARKQKNIFVILYSEDEPSPEFKKICVQCNRSGEPLAVWDANDKKQDLKQYGI